MMSEITDLEEAVHTNTAIFFLLTVATVGIYPVLWLDRNSGIISGITQRRTVDRRFIAALAVCVGLAGMLSNMHDEAPQLTGMLLGLAANVLCIVWAFRAKAALREYCLTEFEIDLKMNVFYTLLANIYYVNYCINNLPEVHRRQQILRGKSVSRQ